MNEKRDEASEALGDTGDGVFVKGSSDTGDGRPNDCGRETVMFGLKIGFGAVTVGGDKKFLSLGGGAGSDATDDTVVSLEGPGLLPKSEDSSLSSVSVSVSDSSFGSI